MCDISTTCVVSYPDHSQALEEAGGTNQPTKLCLSTNISAYQIRDTLSQAMEEAGGGGASQEEERSSSGGERARSGKEGEEGEEGEGGARGGGEEEGEERLWKLWKVAREVRRQELEKVQRWT